MKKLRLREIKYAAPISQEAVQPGPELSFTFKACRVAPTASWAYGAWGRGTPGGRTVGGERDTQMCVNTEVREGDQFPANCRQCACGAYEGSVGASAFQKLPLNRAGGMKRGAEAPCEKLVSYFK